MYKTIGESGTFKQTITKSTFLGFCYKAETPQEAQEIIAKTKKAYPDARHCCWAYVLGEDKSQMRYSDDGEPQGTAGMPILEVIKKKDITNVIVLVVRYFGGVLLGAGGLARAYSSACAGAIENSIISEMILCRRFSLAVDYTAYSRIQKPLEKQKVITENTEYGEKVILTMLSPEEEYEKISSCLTEFTNGGAEIKEESKFFFPWH